MITFLFKDCIVAGGLFRDKLKNSAACQSCYCFLETQDRIKRWPVWMVYIRMCFLDFSLSNRIKPEESDMLVVVGKCKACSVEKCYCTRQLLLTAMGCIPVTRKKTLGINKNLGSPRLRWTACPESP